MRFATPSEMDFNARMALYAEAQDIMNEEVPIYPLYFMLSNTGVSRQLSVKSFYCRLITEN